MTVAATFLLRGTMCVSTVLSAAITSWLVVTLLQDGLIHATEGVPGQYTYIGHDYPVEFPVGDINSVAMTLHESVHFSLNLTDDVANQEWNGVGGPRHHGNTHDGPQFRSFATVFGHQLHCLRILHIGLLSKYGHRNDKPDHHHWQHCLNYLRQTFLCDAADTVEEGDFMERDFNVHRMSGDLVCRDWMAVFAALDKEHLEWQEFNAEWIGPELTE